MSRNLSPLQDAILLRVSHLERLPETRLRDYLATYFRRLDESDEAWCQEFSLALELLVLYGHLRVEELPRKGRLLIDARRNVAQPSASVADTALPAPKPSSWPIAACAASAVLAAGCTLLPIGQPETPPSRLVQLPVYGDGSGFPSRIEQFFNGRSMVYRYCQDDECPSPTPKVAAATPRAEATRYEAVATLRAVAAQGLAAGAAVAASDKVAGATGKPAATLVASASRAALGTTGKAVGAAAPNMLATLTTKETPPAGIALRTDGAFTSYKGMLGFQQGSMVLDGLNRQKVAELAPMAREAEHVRLRGRVATSQLSEEMKKLAVGRAYAVKVEFVKYDVDKAKIRILNPQQATAENATGTVRGVDVMLDMPEKKSLAGTVKEGA